jgi:hypothetical protein
VNGKEFNYASDPKLHVEETPPEVARKAAATVRRLAADEADAADLLAMLGLDEVTA